MSAGTTSRRSTAGRVTSADKARAFTIARAEAVQHKTGIESHHIYGITEGLLMTTALGDGADARFGTLGWPTGTGPS